MILSQKNLLDRIQEGEGLLQEFKTSLEKIDRTMVAFANAKGGIIYLGVNDQGQFRPFRLTNRLKAQIQDIANNLDPRLFITCEDLGKTVAIVVKEGEDKPYRCSDGFFLRSGAMNQKMSRDEIMDLALRINRIRFETLQETRFQYPKNFSKEAFENLVRESHLEATRSSMGEEDFLVSLGVAERQRGRLIFNHAGILFFAKDPQQFLPQAKLSYARYRGITKTDVVDRKIVTGTLPQQWEQAHQKLLFDVPVRYRLADQKTRQEIPSYPMRALEEAVINALIHRDYYEIGAEILIDFFSDRIEISNPGELPAHLKLENLGTKSIRRNSLIAELFYRVGKGERLGSGISRMRSLMNEWKLKLPVFDSSGGFFTVTFVGPGGDVSEGRLLVLPNRQRQFVEERHQIEEPFSSETYANRFQITQRTAQNDLENLLTASILQKEGKGKNTRYRFS